MVFWAKNVTYPASILPMEGNANPFVLAELNFVMQHWDVGKVNFVHLFSDG